MTRQLSRTIATLSALLLSSTIIASMAFAAGVFEQTEYDLGKLSPATNEPFEITLTNAFASKLRILSIKPSCGCTTIDPGTSTFAPKGKLLIRGHIDTRGKIGVISKTLDILTDASPEPVVVRLRAFIPHKPDAAPSSPSVIFQGNCRSCHVGDHVESRSGQSLYDAVCYMCHKSQTSLFAQEPSKLRSIISNGLSGTSMPGFLNTSGGPLTPEQVRSLVELLSAPGGQARP